MNVKSNNNQLIAHKLASHAYPKYNYGPLPNVSQSKEVVLMVSLPLLMTLQSSSVRFVTS